MKTPRLLAAIVALALALPGALHAQDRRGDDRAGGGYMGILFGWDDGGTATVRDVIPRSPADQAGVRRGDTVVRLNGRAATEDAVDDLREHLDRGDTVRLTLRRDGREEQRTIVAGERPRTMVWNGTPGEGGVFAIPGGSGDRRIVIRMDTLEMHIDSLRHRMDSLRVFLRQRTGDSLVIRFDTAVRIMRDSLMRVLPRMEGRMREGITPFFYEFGLRSMAGAEFAEMNPGLGKYFHTNEGLLVLQVGPQTPGARAGLQAGDVVLEANGRRTNRVGDLREAFGRANGQEVRLTVLRDGRRVTVPVRWERPRNVQYRVETTDDGDGPRVRVEQLEPTRREPARP